MSTTRRTSSGHEARTARIFLTRGLIAIAWAAVFMGVAHAQRGDVKVGAGVLLVLYPLIDVIGTGLDAQHEHGSERQLLLFNAAFSAVAAIALGVAATGSVSDVLVVFGVWASVAGAAQLVVGLRRRAVLGNQLPMLLAGGASVLLGIAYVLASTMNNPRLDMLAIYAATGGAEFLIQAWLLTRRRHHVATLPAGSLPAS